MITTKNTNSMIAKTKKAIIKSMAANMNSTNPKRVNMAKAKNMNLDLMKAIKVIENLTYSDL